MYVLAYGQGFVLFVTILHCKVSMVLSGDLVAPLTDLRCSGGLPDRVPTSRKLSSDYRCPTASCVEGSGKHRSQTPTGCTTLQINLCAFVPILHIDRAAITKDPS